MAEVLGQGVFMCSTDWLVLLKTAEAKGGDVDETGSALRDQFSHTGPYRRGNFKPSAAEARRDVEAIDTGGAIEDGPRIRAHVVNPRMPTLVLSLLQRGDAPRCFGFGGGDEVGIVSLVIVVGVWRWL